MITKNLLPFAQVDANSYLLRSISGSTWGKDITAESQLFEDRRKHLGVGNRIPWKFL